MTFGALHALIYVYVSIFLSVVCVTVCFETAVYTHTEMNSLIDEAIFFSNLNI